VLSGRRHRSRARADRGDQRAEELVKAVSTQAALKSFRKSVPPRGVFRDLSTDFPRERVHGAKERAIRLFCSASVQKRPLPPAWLLARLGPRATVRRARRDAGPRGGFSRGRTSGVRCGRGRALRASPPCPHRDGSPASVEAHPFPCISRLNWCVAPESGNG
jgi:hypothetical protein